MRSLATLRLLAPFALFALGSAACMMAADDDAPPPEPPPAGRTYTIEGAVTPAVARRALPPRERLAVTARDVWRTLEAPFPADAPVVAAPALGADLGFATAPIAFPPFGVAGVYVDDAPGAPDLLVRTASDRRIDAQGRVRMDAVAVDRTSVAAWTFNPSLAGRDLEAEGILLVTFVDAAGRPVAGARPYVAASFEEAIDLDFHFLAADLGSVVEGATETTASGAVLVVGGPTVALSAEHDAIVFATVGVAIPAGGAFVETIGPDAP